MVGQNSAEDYKRYAHAQFGTGDTVELATTLCDGTGRGGYGSLQTSENGLMARASTVEPHEHCGDAERGKPCSVYEARPGSSEIPVRQHLQGHTPGPYELDYRNRTAARAGTDLVYGRLTDRGGIGRGSVP